MADKKISALTNATAPLAGTEVLPIVQSNTTVKVAVSDLTAGRSVSGSSFVPSGSTVPANGLYMPTTNAIAFSTDTTQRLYIDAVGTLGIGVVPNTWTSGGNIQLASSSKRAITTVGTILNIGTNWYYASGTGDTYVTTAAAANYTLDGGLHKWSTAASGTAGTAISFSEVGRFGSDGTFRVRGNGSAGTTDAVQFSGSAPASALALDSNGNFTVGSAALATNATNGFFYIPTCAGAPTGTPTAKTGRVPMVYDSTNNDFYIYNGAWKKVTLA